MQRLLHTLLYLAVVGIAAAISYSAGFYKGKADMDAFCGVLIDSVVASVRAENLQVMVKAISDIKNSKSADAEAKLALMVRIQATIVSECSLSPNCNKLTGKPLPTNSELNAYRALQ